MKFRVKLNEIISEKALKKWSEIGDSLEENWLVLKRVELFSVARVAVNVFAEPPAISPGSRRPVKIEKEKQAISFARAFLSSHSVIYQTGRAFFVLF